VDQKRIADLKARISSDPENLIDRFVLLSAYHEGKAWEEAVGEGREILKRRPDYIAVYVLLGEALLRAGRKEEARELLLKGKELADKFGHRAPKDGIARLLGELG
jgi:tetratricopeptide (TPR) repeat protein